MVAPPVTLARLVRSLNRRKIPAQIVHLENGKMEPGRSTANVVPRAGPLELKDKVQTAPNAQPANIKMEKESKLAKTVQPERPMQEQDAKVDALVVLTERRHLPPHQVLQVVSTVALDKSPPPTRPVVSGAQLESTRVMATQQG